MDFAYDSSSVKSVQYSVLSECELIYLFHQQFIDVSEVLVKGKPRLL